MKEAQRLVKDLGDIISVLFPPTEEELEIVKRWHEVNGLKEGMKYSDLGKGTSHEPTTP